MPLSSYKELLRRESKRPVPVVLFDSLEVLCLCVVYLVLLCLFIHSNDIIIKDGGCWRKMVKLMKIRKGNQMVIDDDNSELY